MDNMEDVLVKLGLPKDTDISEKHYTRSKRETNETKPHNSAPAKKDVKGRIQGNLKQPQNNQQKK